MLLILLVSLYASTNGNRTKSVYRSSNTYVSNAQMPTVSSITCFLRNTLVKIPKSAKIFGFYKRHITATTSLFLLPTAWYYGLIWKSDIYDGPPVPKPTQKENIVFTTPVLQAMQQLKISEEEIVKLINAYPNQDGIDFNNLHLKLRYDPQTSTRRITGLWKYS